MVKSLLIANRGEIACRIIRTARKLGIRTVAVYSDADAKALHVREADAAVHIGPSPARESYLVGEKIIAAARESGAEAIHPGYGFLSENAGFAQAVIDAGLVWVGPDPSSITAMGLKDAAKKLMAEAGVPVTPGYLGEDQDPARLKAEADAIGYPVLIKAVAGGGGKGMRRVDAAEEFADALLSCKREAASSFGDDRVLIEKYILRPRHIEVQVFGDRHGNVVHLFERDCSLQRRHQKVIEEAPAPGMDEATRAAVCGAAVRAAQAVNYVGAGTIEFIADASEGLKADRIWFMEMNTRLQVEHPVTEEITGQDLVEWQLRVASGEELPLTQEELAIDGWAMEARLYAEDPATFLPSIGRLELFDLDNGDEARVETGFEPGDSVSSFYDPMVAKLIAWAPSRDEAVDRLAHIVDNVEVWPVKVNASLLSFCLSREAFQDGEVTTAFIEQHLPDFEIPEDTPDFVWAHAAAYLRLKASREDGEDALTGFRLNADARRSVWLSDGRETRAAEAATEVFQDAVRWDGEDALWLTYAGKTYRLGVPRGQDISGGAGGAAGDGAIVSPMPGKIIALDVAAGEAVTKGQKLLTLEAMKMEHSLTAPFDGKVAELNATAGAQVSEGALLVRIEKGEG
ncbi:MAG TPA: acetyl/propionyl/methylcrotonyl-CoA carboxylase subunit alpha [Allosphingosinicella sp.]|nr:acetyl/propionyl/methylcrotonyl-CoA carboxylase subunit alpha [Allosphingosinicella sp.]